MKHVFYTHSHITYLVSLRVIELEKLTKEHCIILFSRGFKPTFDSEFADSCEFPFSYYPVDSFPFFKKFWKGWARLQQLDKFLENITKGENFIFYLPQSYMKPFKLIASNSKCVGYNYIEEGLGVYNTIKQINAYFPPRKLKSSNYIKSLLNYGQRLSREDHFFEPSYIKVYGVSEDSFPGFPRKKVVGLPSLPKKSFTEIENVLVFDAVVEASYIHKSTLAYALLLLISHLKERNVKTVHYKFHPVQLQANITPDIIRNLFSMHNAHIEFKEIDQSISLESIAYNTPVDFYIIISSIGLYATLYNRKVYSIVNYISEVEPAFKQRFEALPKALRESVELL